MDWRSQASALKCEAATSYFDDMISASSSQLVFLKPAK